MRRLQKWFTTRSQATKYNIMIWHAMFGLFVLLPGIAGLDAHPTWWIIAYPMLVILWLTAAFLIAEWIDHKE